MIAKSFCSIVTCKQPTLRTARGPMKNVSYPPGLEAFDFYGRCTQNATEPEKGNDTERQPPADPHAPPRAPDLKLHHGTCREPTPDVATSLSALPSTAELAPHGKCSMCRKADLSFVPLFKPCMAAQSAQSKAHRSSGCSLINVHISVRTRPCYNTGSRRRTLPTAHKPPRVPSQAIHPLPHNQLFYCCQLVREAEEWPPKRPTS